MKEIFLSYAKAGVMTKEELADVLKIKPSTIGAMARRGEIPRIAGLHAIRFDPMVMIELYCTPQKPAQGQRSLTIERHKTRAKTTGGYRKCL